MIPASLSSSYALLDNKLKKVLEFMAQRLKADLGDLHLVSIIGRPKKPDSVLQKLHTGKYQDVAAMTDLVALTVVVLYRHEVQQAIQAVKSGGLQIVEEPTRAIQATDFKYREPKLYVKPPADYLDRNEDLREVVCEVQFTTAIQHALDMTTHDFDYKGHSYSWGNFRLVAQLRGTLELVDRIIDDIEKVSIPNSESIEAPPELLYASSILEAIVARVDDKLLPADHRRMADTAAAWARAAELTSSGFADLLDRNRDLLDATSLDPTSAILGAILREHRDLVLSNFEGRFCISGELESLCVEAKLVPEERRVILT